MPSIRVLITGDKGYIGSNLKRFLRKKGFEVKGYDIKDGKDILDTKKFVLKMKSCHFIYHCAAIVGVQACQANREQAYKVNVIGTRNVVALAFKLGVTPILFSSFAVYGKSYYGELKRQNEKFATKAVILRLSNVFGGEEYQFKDLVLNHFARDSPIRVYGGNQKRDFVHISMVLEKCLEAQTFPYGIYDVCSGEETTIRKLALMFSTIRNVPIKYLPMRNEGESI